MQIFLYTYMQVSGGTHYQLTILLCRYVYLMEHVISREEEDYNIIFLQTPHDNYYHNDYHIFSSSHIFYGLLDDVMSAMFSTPAAANVISRQSSIALVDSDSPTLDAKMANEVDAPVTTKRTSSERREKGLLVYSASK
jgi:hypothetical protein